MIRLLLFLLLLQPTPPPTPAPVVITDAHVGAPPPCGPPDAPYWLIRFGSVPAEYLPCDAPPPTLQPAPTPLPGPLRVQSYLGVVLENAEARSAPVEAVRAWLSVVQR